MTTLRTPAKPTLQPGVWRAPSLSLRFWRVFQRNLLVWRKLAIPSLVGNIAEALYSAFSRMHVQKTWDSILNAPVGLDDIVLAEMLWAAFKSLFTVTAIL